MYLRASLLIFLCSTLCVVNLFGQEDLNELFKRLKSEKQDTTKIDILSEIAYVYENTDLDKALEYYDKAIFLAKKSNATKKIAAIYSHKALVYQYLQEYESAVDWLNKSIELASEIGDTLRVAKGYINLGNTYFFNDKINLAIPVYKKCLYYCSFIDAEILAGAANRGIGNCYDKMENFEYSIMYHKRALEIDLRNKFEYETSMDYSNLATVYIDVERYEEANKYFDKAIQMLLKLGIDGEKLAITYNNQASLNYNQGKYSESLELFYKAKEQFQLSKETASVPFINKNIASCLLGIGDIELAKIYIDSALMKITMQNNPRIALDAKLVLAEILMKLNRHDEAARLLLQSYNQKDSLESSYQREKLSELEVKFQTKEKDLKLQKSAKDLRIKQAESERNQMLIIGLSGVGLLLLLLFFNVRKANRTIKKANGFIEEQNVALKSQKLQIEETNNAIISSIRYAQNLQNAILPSKDVIADSFTNHFCIYLPKDIVAGDFYWIESHNELTYFAVADCTGHGVPGAMVSVVCYNALNQALKDYSLIDPGKILDKTRELVIKTFEKNTVNLKDGMDIALFSINLKSAELKFAGANNPLLIYQDNTLIKLTGNRQPIGYTESQTPFDTQIVQLKPTTRLYAFSDGFADQFGGPDDKKYKSKQMENFISSIQHLSLSEQEEVLVAEFNNWKGIGEQTDDVTVICLEL